MLTNFFISQVPQILADSSSIGSVPLVGGVEKMMQSILNALLILIPVAAGAMEAYHSVRKVISSGDSAVIADTNRKMKNVLIAAVIGESATVIVNYVLSCFQ